MSSREALAFADLFLCRPCRDSTIDYFHSTPRPEGARLSPFAALRLELGCPIGILRPRPLADLLLRRRRLRRLRISVYSLALRLRRSYPLPCGALKSGGGALGRTGSPRSTISFIAWQSGYEPSPYCLKRLLDGFRIFCSAPEGYSCRHHHWSADAARETPAILIAAACSASGAGACLGCDLLRLHHRAGIALREQPSLCARKRNIPQITSSMKMPAHQQSNQEQKDAARAQVGAVVVDCRIAQRIALIE